MVNASATDKTTNTFDRHQAWQIAAAVVDPEIPVLTVEDLGILRSIEADGCGDLIVKVTPTYSGCPAVGVIEEAIHQALTEAGYRATIERVISPPWTTDWITEAGRKKMLAYGIAPPLGTAGTKRALFSQAQPPCPQCGSDKTTIVSEFGSTACKSLYRCEQCLEPFDYFKCL